MCAVPSEARRGPMDALELELWAVLSCLIPARKTDLTSMCS